ncbi:unnamed protein product (macronuclear) [Paramecium tetraurelia]|uniref:Kinesin motor domain-containing protein n=1 Tax=Paramecium tetraurelia TaxID=5888 RepID=A0BR73_PARTE|nr:uncharacterized protein GSPATT00031270001 [Paramecium tetraurelia]CAK61040.1 unnamed protein product [Paramecium tetraurelia]|eukprot:XP_001428438.1 hypothetical protein (macronuclear) [Paramecium tetraurelia strain d4-2]
MQNRITNANQNYKIFARVRPIDYQQKMVDFTNESISIRDPTNKNAESKIVSFSSVCTTQEHVYKVIEPMLQKLIEGHNSCILSYGQTGSGKSYTLFGQEGEENKPDKRGIITGAIDYLLSKAQEFEEIREFEITATMAELFLDQVRDLGKAYKQRDSGNMNQLIQNYENENLSLLIKDISQIAIRSAKELTDMIQMGFQMREKLEQQSKSFGQKCHTVITLTLVQKDKENQNLQFMNAFIQFVDLAGSERIAKSLTQEGQFQEAILINQSLTALSKCLTAISQMNSKNIPYRDSKLTRILQSCLNSQSQIALMVHINPNENNFEECLSALQYAERTKGITASQPIDDNSNQPGPFPGQDKLIKKLQDENTELKAKVDFLQKEHKQKLSEIQNLLGIDVDLEKLFARMGAQELQKYKIQKDAMQKVETLSNYVKEAEYMIEKLQKEKELMKKEESIKLERQQCKNIEQKEEIRKLKGKQQLEQIEQEKNDKILDTVKKQLKEHQQVIEKKVNVIINLPQNIQTKTQEVQKHEDIKRQVKNELEKEYKQQMDNLKAEYTKFLQDSTNQYEKYLEKKNEEIDHFIHQFKKYQEKKKQSSHLYCYRMQIKDMKVELFELYDVVMKTFRVIEKIENGAYSSGIRSFNIPAMDKPNIPTRNKFKNLFKYLDQRSLKNTKLDAIKEKLAPKPLQMSQFLENNNIKMNLTKMPEPTVRQFASMIRDELVSVLAREKELQKRVTELEILQSSNDLNTLIKERDEYKQHYLQEVKKMNQSKRIISSKFESQPNLLIRPLTQQHSRYRL